MLSMTGWTQGSRPRIRVRRANLGAMHTPIAVRTAGGSWFKSKCAVRNLKLTAASLGGGRRWVAGWARRLGGGKFLRVQHREKEGGLA